MLCCARMRHVLVLARHGPQRCRWRQVAPSWRTCRCARAALSWRKKPPLRTSPRASRHQVEMLDASYRDERVDSRRCSAGLLDLGEKKAASTHKTLRKPFPGGVQGCSIRTFLSYALWQDALSSRRRTRRLTLSSISRSYHIAAKHMAWRTFLAHIHGDAWGRGGLLPALNYCSIAPLH